MRIRAGLMAIVALAATGVASADPPPLTPPRSCAWVARMDSGVVNTAYPDKFANYWFLRLPAAPGATLTLHGYYPHARYMSLVSYNGAMQSVDGIHDSQIVADDGSINTFVAGADRTVDGAHRRWTVTVDFATKPDPPAQNTLYTSTADKQGVDFSLIYRVYLPDDDFTDDIRGGVDLPSVTYNTPNGSSVDIPTCPFQDAPANDLNQQASAQGQHQSGATSFEYPGWNPPLWHKFYNTPRSLSQGLTESAYTGDQISDDPRVVAAAQSLPKGGFLDNPDNNYIFTVLSHGYGAMAVFHAKLPTTPDTATATVWPEQTQLRYWSMCSNDGPSQRYWGCVDDADVRKVAASDGTFTLVVSTAADRPDPATCACAWLPWGPSGSVVLIVRNMLPAPDFTQAIQSAGYGTEERDMGPYYPVGCYMNAAPAGPISC